MAGIKQALQAWLPEYEVPEHLIRIARVSLTANGKIDRAAIRDKVQSYLNGLRDERAGDFPSAGQSRRWQHCGAHCSIWTRLRVRRTFLRSVATV